MDPKPTPVGMNAERKSHLATAYCTHHQETWHLPDFSWLGLPDLQSKDQYSRIYEGGSILTIDDCLGVIEGLIDTHSFTYEDIERIADGTIWIGMNPHAAQLSVGLPNDINTTTTAAGIHEQWVYGFGGDSIYLYFEGASNDYLRLTSWQNL